MPGAGGFDFAMGIEANEMLNHEPICGILDKKRLSTLDKRAMDIESRSPTRRKCE